MFIVDLLEEFSRIFKQAGGPALPRYGHYDLDPGSGLGGDYTDRRSRRTSGTQSCVEGLHRRLALGPHTIENVIVANQKGNYSFIRGIAPYSGGVIADRGYEVVHARFLHPVSLNQGFNAVKEHIGGAGRPIHALCGMELRSPKPFTFQGFIDFNAGYIQVLKDWGVIAGGVNPIARTNIAPEIGAPQAPALYGFSYTAKATSDEKTFVVAGGGELPEGSLDPHDVVRRGETSADALRDKVKFVMGLMSGESKIWVFAGMQPQT